MEIWKQAEQELAESGTLTFPTRRKLWQALGPWEERPEDDPLPRALTEPLKKRAELALACAKKVSRIWSDYDSEDKRPQALMKRTRAYLDGKISAEALSTESDVIQDFMSIVDEEPSDSAPAAALVAWDALVVALHDEPLLEPRYAGAGDADLDFYDWDAAKNAAMAWRDFGSGGDRGKQAVREMKFWAWYLEQAARLLGEEDYKFPPKYIKAFAEKQEPPRPVPEEVTLESFADYLGGRYYFHTRVLPREGEGGPVKLSLRVWYDGEGGACPKCGKLTRQLDMIWRDCCLWEVPLPGGQELEVLRVMPNFRCPDHPDVLWIHPDSANQVSNYNKAFQHFIKSPGRKQALLEQLERRLTAVLIISGVGLNVSGSGVELRDLERRKQALGLTNAGWVDQSLESYAFDVAQFLPNLYIQNCTFGDFLRYYPHRVRRLEDGSVELELERLWARFWLDEGGNPARVMLTTRFHIWVKGKPHHLPALQPALVELLGLTEEQAAQAIRTAKDGHSGAYELSPLSGLKRPEALRLYGALCARGIECRILPTPIKEL